ncbi:MAG: bile acid:sodium symporter family protein [Verrucomicrobiota bacterium]
MDYLTWIRRNGFVLGLILAVFLAFLFPQPGSRNGFLHPDLVNNLGIALIMFLQGLSLAFERLKRGARNWKMHVIIQSFTFIIFPLVGIGCYFAVPLIWKSEPAAIRQGFLYLCVLPSTISTSVVLTAVAHGNVAGALFNAALSNIIGVVLTPLLVHALMQTTGQSAPLGPLMLKIMLLTLLPFFTGMVLRSGVRTWVEQHKAWVARISNSVIVFIVYTAFCDSVAENIWQQHGAATTVKLFLCVILLFAGMSWLIYSTCSALGLNREDRITAYFCSVKKTLAMGVPLAMLIFGSRNDLPLILLPLMFYHPIQIFINGLLANHWGSAGPIQNISKSTAARPLMTD